MPVWIGKFFMLNILKMIAKTKIVTEKSPLIESIDFETLQKDLSRFEKLDYEVKRALSKSLTIRHLDSGSSNAEEAELLALSNPVYDITRFGIDFTASPRHADVLTISGPVTRQLKIAMDRTYNAMPYPKIVVAVGDGACNGSVYQNTYACLGRVDQFLPVDIYIPGDPPTPEVILKGLLMCKLILIEKKGRL